MEPKLTSDDLYTLRDALIHAERAHANSPDPTLRQKYQELFRRLGRMIEAEQRK